MDHENIQRARIFEEELFKAKNALFHANSVKHVKFLQNKIKYLRGKLEELEG